MVGGHFLRNMHRSLLAILFFLVVANLIGFKKRGAEVKKSGVNVILAYQFYYWKYWTLNLAISIFIMSSFASCVKKRAKVMRNFFVPRVSYASLVELPKN